MLQKQSKTKNICCVEGEGAIDHSTVTRWIKKFCKNINNQARLGRPKTLDLKAVLQAMEAYLVSSTLGVSGKLSISQSNVFCLFMNSVKASRTAKLCFTLPKYCKTFDSV